LNTTTDNADVVVIRLSGMTLRKVEESINVVGNDSPFNLTTEVPSKPLPARVIVTEAEPIGALAGEIDFNTGALDCALRSHVKRTIDTTVISAIERRVALYIQNPLTDQLTPCTLFAQISGIRAF